MSGTKIRPILSSCGIAILILIGLFSGIGGQVRVAGIPVDRKEETDGSSFAAVSLQNSEPVTAYLPLLFNRYPPPPPTFGLQMFAIDDEHSLQLAVDGGVYWVRYQVFPWDLVEPERTEPPSYNWEVVDEMGLANAYENDLSVIAIVHYTPFWAQKYSGSYCGPIRQDRLDEFAQFLTALVNRYKDPPYNVKYWELGNEPDATLGYNRSGFGCWGEEGDPYYGGEYYGQMLQYAYPAIKAADPSAQVLIGGLLLDCDPTHPPPGKDCIPGRFLEGILRAGGSDYFDIVSFHGYPPYDGSLNQDEHYPSWEARGGVVLGKADYLREVMGGYGIDRPLMHTEGSLICPEYETTYCDPPDEEFYDRQADYVIWLFVRNWADEIMATIWYQFEGPGWRYSGMLDEAQNPKPAYHAFHFLTQELGGTEYEGPVTVYSHLRGYAFAAPDKRIWVLWPPDESISTIALPGDVTHVYDKFGNDITPLDGSLTLTSPVYVEMPR